MSSISAVVSAPALVTTTVASTFNSVASAATVAYAFVPSTEGPRDVPRPNKQQPLPFFPTDQIRPKSRLRLADKIQVGPAREVELGSPKILTSYVNANKSLKHRLVGVRCFCCVVLGGMVAPFSNVGAFVCVPYLSFFSLVPTLYKKKDISDGAADHTVPSPWVVGHRGSIYQELENTRQGYQLCAAIGCDAVELDVFVLKCGTGRTSLVNERSDV